MNTQELRRIFISNFKIITSSNVIEHINPVGAFKTLLWIVVISVACTVYFIVYFYPAHLHDIAHFAVSGVSLVRDHKNLIYPYNPLEPGGLGPAYEYFQNATIHFDVRNNYPSKLYSLLFGLICTVTGHVKIEYTQWMSFGALWLIVVLLYFIGRRFFSGIELACFLLAIMFLPVMRFVLNPGTDAFGFLGLLIMLALTVSGLHPFIIGLIGGGLAHFRGQMLSVIPVLPFIIRALSGRSYWIGSVFPLAAGFIITYLVFGSLFGIFTASTDDANPIGFYMKHFSNSAWGLKDIAIVASKFFAGSIALFDKNQLLILASTGLLVLCRIGSPLEVEIAKAGLLYAMLPVLLYSFDRYTLPPARYYLFSVPLLVLATFLFAKNLEFKFRAIRSFQWIFSITIIVLLAWGDVWGIPYAKLNLDNIVSKLQFLDFRGAEQALAENFNENDIVIINHSLPTALSKIHNIIYLPSYKEFINGDNKDISGLVFVYSKEPPNDFFKPSEWLENNEMPNVFIDSKGIVFKRVFDSFSEIIGVNGTVDTKAFFYIFKRIP